MSYRTEQQALRKAARAEYKPATAKPRPGMELKIFSGSIYRVAPDGSLRKLDVAKDQVADFVAQVASR
jgi:hypothetical protein